MGFTLFLALHLLATEGQCPLPTTPSVAFATLSGEIRNSGHDRWMMVDGCEDPVIVAFANEGDAAHAHLQIIQDDDYARMREVLRKRKGAGRLRSRLSGQLTAVARAGMFKHEHAGVTSEGFGHPRPFSRYQLIVTRVEDVGQWAPDTECSGWTIRVDPSLGEASPHLEAMPSDSNVVEAIGCLLLLQGNTNPGRFGGATAPSVSQVLPPSTVELAALYYASYLYTGRWQHADGVALWNAKGVINPPGSIDAAYASYRKWFEAVKRTGIAAAREKQRDPLRDTGLSWYGR